MPEELSIEPMSNVLTETILTTTSANDPEESDHSDATFDFEQTARSNSQEVLEQFVEEWVTALDRENTISLALFLTYNLMYTNAAEYTGIMIGKSE